MILYRIIWGFCHILYPLCRLEVSGRENLPKGAAIICPNHSGIMDPVFLYLALPVDYRLQSMGKDSLFHIPVLRRIIKAFGAFPVKRGQHDLAAIKTSLHILQNDGHLMLFPEGTRVRNGVGKHDGKPAHAHSGIAMFAERTGAPMIPVFIEPNRKPFRKVRLIFGKPITVEKTEKHRTTEELREVATKVLSAAYALGGMQIGGEPLCE